MARRKDQAARRRQLAQAAGRAIAARGIGGVRLKDVAAEAGLSSQSVLYYYPDLRQLVEHAIEHTLERFAQRRAAAAAAIDNPRAALISTIRPASLPGQTTRTCASSMRPPDTSATTTPSANASVP